METRVSKDEFFSTIGKMNVHPRAERDCTYWETPNRVVLGRSIPGYLCVGEKAYFLADTGRRALAEQEED
jgi:hypothetical protein